MAFGFTNGSLHEAQLVWQEIKSALSLDDKIEIRKKLQGFGQPFYSGGKLQLENPFTKPLMKGSPSAYNIIQRDSVIYPHMPSIYHKFKSTVEKSEMSFNLQKSPILSVVMSPREKSALRQHLKVKKLEKQLGQKQNKNYQTQIKLKAYLDEEKRLMDKMEK